MRSNDKARYLLDHDDERQRIAETGQRRTLREHTIARRVEQLHALISAHLTQ
ncbi:MAG: glycosyltransferase [Anaerolineae bacterium]|nr:glycosyltransferase [Anaerolineae bacterium]